MALLELRPEHKSRTVKVTCYDSRGCSWKGETTIKQGVMAETKCPVCKKDLMIVEDIPGMDSSGAGPNAWQDPLYPAYGHPPPDL